MRVPGQKDNSKFCYKYGCFVATNYQRDNAAGPGASAGNRGHSRRQQRTLLSRHGEGAERFAVRGRHLQTRALLAGGLSDVGAQGALHHQDLPSEHRSSWPHLLGHSQGQMEPGAPDPHRAAVHPGAAQRTQSGRSVGQRRCRAVEDPGERGHSECTRMDPEVRQPFVRKHTENTKHTIITNTHNNNNTNKLLYFINYSN